MEHPAIVHDLPATPCRRLPEKSDIIPLILREGRPLSRTTAAEGSAVAFKKAPSQRGPCLLSASNYPTISATSRVSRVRLLSTSQGPSLSAVFSTPLSFAIPCSAALSATTTHSRGVHSCASSPAKRT